jgi:hypothetical protein
MTGDVITEPERTHQHHLLHKRSQPLTRDELISIARSGEVGVSTARNVTVRISTSAFAAAPRELNQLRAPNIWHPLCMGIVSRRLT